MNCAVIWIDAHLEANYREKFQLAMGPEYVSDEVPVMCKDTILNDINREKLEKSTGNPLPSADCMNAKSCRPPWKLHAPTTTVQFCLSSVQQYQTLLMLG